MASSRTRVRIPLRTFLLERRGDCYMAYPGLGNRSIFHPGGSVGSTITFGIVEDTSSNPTSNISFKRSACACVRLIINMSPQIPRIWIEVWVGTYDCLRRPVNRYVPKIPPFQGGGECYKAYPGLGNRSHLLRHYNLVHWATGKRLINRLTKLSLTSKYNTPPPS